MKGRGIPGGYFKVLRDGGQLAAEYFDPEGRMDYTRGVDLIAGQKITMNVEYWSRLDVDGKKIYRRDANGSWTNQSTGNNAPTFNRLEGIAARGGLIFVVDSSSNKVYQKLVQEWTDISNDQTWSKLTDISYNNGDLVMVDNGTRTIWKRPVGQDAWIDFTAGLNQPTFNSIDVLSTDGEAIYVVDGTVNHIYRKEDGQWFDESFGEDVPKWDQITGISVDNGIMYVVDKGLRAVYRRVDGKWEDATQMGSNKPSLRDPFDVALNDDQIVVLDTGNREVYLYRVPIVGADFQFRPSEGGYVPESAILPGSSQNPLAVSSVPDLVFTEATAGPRVIHRFTNSFTPQQNTWAPGLQWKLMNAGIEPITMDLGTKTQDGNANLTVMPYEMITVISLSATTFMVAR